MVRLGRPKSYPAFPITQNKYRFYLSTIPVTDLFPWSFVSSRDEDPVKGFQRALSFSRAEDIAKYLAKRRGSIPTNIVVSAQEDANILYDSRSKTLSFKRREGAFLVLDGQHRLWGYQICMEQYGHDFRVPVAIFEKLKRSDEATLFIDINTTQRGVPVALLLDIKNLAHKEDISESILRVIFDKLADDARSPLLGKLSKSKSVVGKISRVTFNRAVGPIISSSVLANLDDEDTYKLIRNYLAAFDVELGINKKLLLKSAYFHACFQVFEDVIRTCLSTENNLKQDSIQKIIKPIVKIDMESQASNRTALTHAMRAAMHSAVKISRDKL